MSVSKKTHNFYVFDDLAKTNETKIRINENSHHINRK